MHENRLSREKRIRVNLYPADFRTRTIRIERSEKKQTEQTGRARSSSRAKKYVCFSFFGVVRFADSLAAQCVRGSASSVA